MSQTVELFDQYVSEFERSLAEGSGQPSWLSRARRAAVERFQSLGFPRARDEEWRFTSVAPIAERRFRIAAEGSGRFDTGDLAAHRYSDLAPAELTFVNGRYAADLSTVSGLPQNVHVSNLRSALAASPALVEQYLTRVTSSGAGAFPALNTAFLTDAAVLFVPARVVVDRPIHVLFVSAPEANGRDAEPMSHPRLLVVMGERSRATLIETHAGIAAAEGVYLVNAVSEIVLHEGAALDHARIQRDGLKAFHMGTTHVSVGRAATYTANSVSLGGALVRNDISALMGGEGGECTLNGLYFSDGRRLVDNHTTIDHAVPHCSSREVYKGILAGHARAVFNGKIVVRPDAQKTDAKQTNKALLLSDDAQINTKPELEIFANDVRCTHGAAVGQIDEDAIFYLRSRGFGEREARSLLIRAFAGDVIHKISLAPVRDAVEAELLRQLPGSPQPVAS